MRKREPQVAAAWLAPEEDDHDVLAFLTYLIAAVQNRAPTVGGFRTVPANSATPPTEALLTALLNDFQRPGPP
ncbi:MAG: hypothetical protein IPK17_38950 [Chloroflexi bacterium]|uniref:hypothetical protein n=1 Tax=Candidatus Flexifilum breve TaxID=3140694 RepID=UPI0031373DF5|nr:hypothetical protein [Chloroflexota bacterium]